MLVSGVGIGGGGKFVPILIIFLRFAPKIAIPLSAVTIVGLSLANLIINVPRRHPVADRPLIAWDIIVVMEPPTMMGAVLGSFINVVSPMWILDLMLILFLTGITVQTWKKGEKLYKKETEAAEYSEIPASDIENDADAATESKAPAKSRSSIVEYDDTTSESGLSRNPSAPSEPQKTPGDDWNFNFFRGWGSRNQETGKVQTAQMVLENTDIDEEKRILLENLIETEKRHSPFRASILIATCAVILFLSMAKGHPGFNPFKIPCESGVYWTVAILPIPFTLLVTAYVRQTLLDEGALKEYVGYPYVEGDIVWTQKTTVLYPFMCMFAGISAGLFGIGGGLVKTPLMLWMGVPPEVAAATSSTMLVFTATTSSIAFLTFGRLNANYAALLMPLGFICCFFGRYVLDYLVNKYARPSFVVFLLSIGVGLSTVGVAVESRAAFESLFAGHLVHGAGGLCTR